MATLIKTDGTIKQVKPANGRYFTLEEKQRFVGGLIEFIPTREGNWLTINEEGKLNGLPINRTATLMYAHSIVWKENEHPAFNDIVVGDNSVSVVNKSRHGGCQNDLNLGKLFL